MKVIRYDTILGLCDNNLSVLNKFRQYRGFDVEKYLKFKVHRIAKFFMDSGRDSVILGISGGIDSALALFLLDAVSQQINLNIHPVFIGMGTGVSEQSLALKDAKSVVSSIGRELKIIDLSIEQSTIEKIVQQSLDKKSSVWSSGQFASCLRSPVYYYIASLLTDKGENP